MYENLLNKIKERKAVVGVIGLGYVGLPYSVAIAQAGFRVIGIDVNRERVEKINAGISITEDVSSEELREVIGKNFVATTDYSSIKDIDVINICVPTPFTRTKDPDISYIKNSMLSLIPYLKKGTLIILRSTTYPGTTREVLKPMVEEKGFIAGEDVFLAFSPERINPGDKKYGIKNTPIVVGGLTKKCTELAKEFLQSYISHVFPVSSPEVAELTKLLENIFRSVNIALVNELAMLCERMGNIDIWEVISAASTKPFGFMPFYPGPGIGGHCILVDPYYLSWKAREYDFHSDFIEFAAKVNENMPYFVVNKMYHIINRYGKSISDSKVLFLGVAFKGDISDTRNSPAIKVMEIIEGSVKKMDYHDPHVPQVKINGKLYNSIDLTPEIVSSYDMVVITTPHKSVDYEMVKKYSRIIFDTRNIIKERGIKNLYVLGFNRKN